MTRMLSKPKRSLETASVNELLSAISEFHEVEDLFGDLTDDLTHFTGQMNILFEDFDDFDLGRLVRLPRTSVEECDFEGVDFIFETRQGQRLARDLS